MLCDDRPSHPMTVVVRLRFSGQLDRPAWEEAVHTVVRRHALLRATIDRTAGRRLHWVDHPDWLPEVTWQAAASPYGFPLIGYVDLTQQPGTRFWVVDREPGQAGEQGQDHEQGQDAVIQIHHACADGLGIVRMLEDLLTGYAQRVNAAEHRSPLPNLDFESFRQRGAPGLTVGAFLKTAHRQALGLLGACEFLLRSPAPLGPPNVTYDPLTPPPIFPCPHCRELDSSTTRGLLAAAKSLGVTLNDLLLRDIFLTITQWRRERGFGSEGDWLRVSVPMNLRRAADALMPMANSVSSVFLDRRATDCADPERLLRGVQRQMQLIKRNQLQYTFLLSLGLSRYLPGGLASRTNANRCELSSYFSNVGPVLDRVPLPRRDGRLVCGNVELAAVDVVIPLRPFVNASFCAHTYGGRLSVLMHPDLRVLPEEAATRLLDDFMRRLRESAGMTMGSHRQLAANSCELV